MRNLPPEVLTAFWNRVNIGADESDCWLWVGNITQAGYGRFHFPVKQRGPAHRIAYELVRGEIPEGLEPDHLCRNRACVNPFHLELVTRKENVLRGIGPTAKNKEKTHCKNGHPFTPENTRIRKHEWRECKICTLERKRKWERKRRKNAKNVHAD